MAEINWSSGLDKIKNYSFKVSTPQGSGTGFLITYRKKPNFYGIATAYHVIAHAYNWETPIKLLSAGSGQEKLLHTNERVIITNPKKDVAIILVSASDLNIPADLPNLCPEDRYLKPGEQVAWAGYPAVAPNQFSFFMGCVSSFIQSSGAYLMDGVAINGVSGGPAFTVIGNDIHIIGLVSAYIPNRLGGESLPGVCFVVGIYPFYEMVKNMKNFEDAEDKAKEQNNN
ncbi:MAG: trypsin-like peptidase domain-containing protein [Candidatus Marinimicrobia bacterium]|nr:trypsin-like peptidase domain-containing protein [Candidatus Neomarinimicrobiota bacterium]